LIYNKKSLIKHADVSARQFLSDRVQGRIQPVRGGGDFSNIW